MTFHLFRTGKAKNYHYRFQIAGARVQRSTRESSNPDKNKPMRIKLYGPGSKQYAKVQAANNNKLFTRLKKKGKEDQSAEDQAQEGADKLAALTHSFENISYDDLAGEALHKAVYLDETIGFIPAQVNSHLNDWANFTKTSAKN